jgi:hypothetical protein
VQDCEEGGSNKKILIIVGAVVGGVLLLLIVGLIVAYFVIRYRKGEIFDRFFWSVEKARNMELH